MLALLLNGSFYDVFHHPHEVAVHIWSGLNFPAFVWKFQGWETKQNKQKNFKEVSGQWFLFFEVFFAQLYSLPRPHGNAGGAAFRLSQTFQGDDASPSKKQHLEMIEWYTNLLWLFKFIYVSTLFTFEQTLNFKNQLFV